MKGAEVTIETEPLAVGKKDFGGDDENVFIQKENSSSKEEL
jgi:hypothetical protein